ncbi:synaptobrevin [Apiospora sp. TS-2023a]
MARLTQEPMTPRRSVSNPDSLTDLNRLLGRLQQSILQANAEQERRLRTSEYERNKVGINLEYARTLLTKVEQDASSVKVHTRRQDLQADLNRKREIFEQLTERLRELEDLSIDSDEEDESDEDSEDLLAGIIHTPSDSPNPIRPDDEDAGQDASFEQEDDDEAEVTVLHVPQSTTSSHARPTATAQPAAIASRTSEQPGTATSQTVRTRGKGGAEATQAGAGADTADTTARNQLFGNKPSSATTALSTTATTEAILDHQREEQDKLTESLLGMASALKSSSRAFATSLEEEKDVLNSAGTGLEKNERGLDAAARRMGTLRKMSEGRGMIGRYILMATIAGMWVLALLLVFVMPKLRF